MVSRETRLTHFADALFEANKQINLVSRRLGRSDVRAMVDSFARTLDVLGLSPPTALLDVGTGGGLPGIPLAIQLPTTRVILVESRKLRVAWLKQAVAELDLSNATVLGGRVQDYPELTGSFPVVTAFGVGRAQQSLLVCVPFLGPGGVAVLSAPARPTPTDESEWLLAAAVNGASVAHHPDALAGGRALLTVHRDP